MRGCVAAEIERSEAAIKQSTANLLVALQRAYPEICGAPPTRWRRTRKSGSASDSIDHLIAWAAELTGIPRAQLLGPDRTARLARVRFAIVHVAVNRGYSYSAIGREMQRDHSSILHADRRALELLATDADFARLRRRIGART